MRLTAFTDYSLRVLIFLAAEPGRRATIGEIATAFGVKENHLTKVVHFLGKAGFLSNVRGKGGGLDLALAPQDIVVGNVVRLTEGAAMPAECFGEGGGDCSIVHCCRLRGVLGEAVDAFYLVLDGYTLTDLVSNRQALAPLLFVPPDVVKRARAARSVS
jgi:Rrf2 family nitric oxide-sensitive transcriptional repressor